MKVSKSKEWEKKKKRPERKKVNRRRKQCSTINRRNEGRPTWMFQSERQENVHKSTSVQEYTRDREREERREREREIG